MSALPILPLLSALALSSTAGLATESPPRKAVSVACLPGPAQTARRVDDWTLDVLAGEGRRFRIDLDRSCAGIKDAEPMQLASTGDGVCADGRAAAVTAGAICPVIAITEDPPAPANRCFKTARVRSFAALRGNRLEVQLRGGSRHVLQLEASCAQLDRFAAISLVSGAADGRICGRPGDAVYGSLDDGVGATLAGGFARQFSGNDFQPCRIVEVLPVEG
ncbi:MAG: hypothetical protein ACK52N_00005 [Lysobacteraceae bacterium]